VGHFGWCGAFITGEVGGKVAEALNGVTTGRKGLKALYLLSRAAMLGVK